MNLSHGHIVREPVGHRNGFWSGAPGVFHDPTEKAWYLTYRLRRPRGVNPDRGGESRIARSTDLKHWKDIWSVQKSEFKTPSIERSCIYRGDDKIWRYFTSFVNPADGRWCVAMLRDTEVDQLYSRNIEIIFKAPPLKLEGIKDPWIIKYEDVYHMFLSIAVPTAKTTDQAHDTQDIFNTGQCISATGLAVSRNLDHWQWKGVVFRPEPTGWDSYCRRINSVVAVNENFFGFYDGSAGPEENYEEKTGVAVSPNLRAWRSLTRKGPAYISPLGTHSLRYVDAHELNGQANIFYEYARADGAHEMRLLTVDKAAFHAALEPLTEDEPSRE
jgi:hypothetical protein